MAEKDPGTPDESSLELPSFGLRRRKRKRDAADAAAPGATAPEAEKVTPEDAATDDAATREDAAAPVPSAPSPAEVAGESAAVEPVVVEPVVVEPVAVEPVVVEPEVVAQEPPAVPEDGSDEPTVIVETPVAPSSTAPASTAPHTPATSLAKPAPSAARLDHDTLVDEDRAISAEPVQADAEEDGAGTDPETGADSSGFALPALGAMTAALVTGLVIGLAMVGLTAGSMRGCKAVNGTSTCGNPGLLLVLAILITLIFAGAALLRAWDVADPGSTSFLAVGVTTVIALVFLIDVLFAWWMVIVIPLVSMLAYALSHWVARNFTEPARD